MNKNFEARTLAASPFLHEIQHPPRAEALLHRFGSGLDASSLHQVLDEIWQEVLGALQQPVVITHSKQCRSVTLLGVIRYRVVIKTGKVSVLQRCLEQDRHVFRKVDAICVVDLPGIKTGYWAQLFLHPWRQHILQKVLREPKQVDDFYIALAEEINRATLRSVWWKKIRYALRNALALDKDILRWCRKGSHRHAQAVVTLERYNRTLAHRRIYVQLERENPNLIWVYNLALDDSIYLEPGDAVAALRTAILRNPDATPACWRLLCRSKEQDFRMVVDWYFTDGGIQERWREIVPWLSFLLLLRRKTPVPRAVQSLFIHDSVEINRAEQSARIRDIWIPVQVIRVLLQEAERRHAVGRLQAFAERELTDVVTWYGAIRPSLDKNQIKQGFAYLVRRAEEWKREVSAHAELIPLRWGTAVADVQIGPWTIVHLADAFTLRQEALRMHHCADRFAEDCLERQKSIFSVRNANDKSVATLGLERFGSGWQVFAFRGFANQPAPAGLAGLDAAVCRLYQEYWQTTRPLEADWDEEDEEAIYKEAA